MACLPLREEGAGATVEVKFYASNDLFRRDHVHTPGQAADDIQAKAFRSIFVITITERNDSRPPAPALSATGKRADRVDELVMRISFPVGRFSSARDHNAGAILGCAWFSLDGCRQVHVQRHRTQNSLRVIDQENQLPQIRLAAQVDHAVQWRVIMTALANLHEKDFIAEMIHHRLEAPK